MENVADIADAVSANFYSHAHFCVLDIFLKSFHFCVIVASFCTFLCVFLHIFCVQIFKVVYVLFC